MNHIATPDFWECYRALPVRVRDVAGRCFDTLKENPRHPSLHLKKAGRYWSVRVGRQYRAAAVERVEGLVWFWIGTHAEYDKLIE